MKYLISLLLVIFSFSISKGVEEPFPFFNPAPPWVKKGLVAVYSFEGGSASGVNTPRGSGVYGKGYVIYVVFDVYNRKPYGLKVTLLASANSTFFDSRLVDLSTSFFYLDAPSINRDIREKKSPPNCRLTGKVGRIFMKCLQNGLSSKFIIFYNPKSGLVENFVVSQNSANGNVSQARTKYLKHFYVNLPNVKHFPKPAFENHSYVIYSFTPMGAMPVGDLNVKYRSRKGQLLYYWLTGEGYPVPVEALGLSLSGPDYIHPAWLSERVLLNVPEAGFEIVKAGRGSRGGVLLEYVWQGISLMEQEFDPKTGLLLYQRVFLPGGFSVVSELRN